MFLAESFQDSTCDIAVKRILCLTLVMLMSLSRGESQIFFAFENYFSRSRVFRNAIANKTLTH